MINYCGPILFKMFSVILYIQHLISQLYEGFIATQSDSQWGLYPLDETDKLCLFQLIGTKQPFNPSTTNESGSLSQECWGSYLMIATKVTTSNGIVPQLVASSRWIGHILGTYENVWGHSNLSSQFIVAIHIFWFYGHDDNTILQVAMAFFLVRSLHYEISNIWGLCYYLSLVTIIMHKFNLHQT